MRADAHISVTRAEVRNKSLSRHRAVRLDSGKCFVVTTGVGLPRTWSYTTDAVLDGFERGLAATEAREMARLAACYEGARSRLRRRCDALLERMTPDASLIGVLLGATDVHVVSTGTGRVYLHRESQPQRLTPRKDPEGGLISGVAARSSTTVEPGDVVIAGSVSAFSVKAIARLASVLEADLSTPPSVLASLLTEPAGHAGVGAAAVVLRIR